MEEFVETFLKMGQSEKIAVNSSKNLALCTKFKEAIRLYNEHIGRSDFKENGVDLDKDVLLLIYETVTFKFPRNDVVCESRRFIPLKYIARGELTRHKLRLLMEIIKKVGKGDLPPQDELERQCGIGVKELDDAELSDAIGKVIEKVAARDGELTRAAVTKAVREELYLVEPKRLHFALQSYIKEHGVEFAEKKQKGGKKKKATKKKKKGKGGSETVRERFSRPEDNTLNHPWILKKHLEATGGRIVTRFPPEPNGYLHIGHVKAMNLDFGYAKKLGGICYLRFDDTNPASEKQEYIDAIIDNVKWFGFEIYKITYSSDYFDKLYELAVELIKRGKAYVCFQSKEEIREYRRLGKESPTRNKDVEWNLKEFEKMRTGFYDDGEAVLRMKQDMKDPNMNMRDLIAYRIIKKTPHPRTGTKWIMYPSYDFTHCIVDSLENITHSLCTLEFQIRQKSYYWLLDALDLYKPVVWEFGRLNLTYTVMSKRKLQYLVNEGIVSGWDDPVMPTINGYIRRGYTPTAILDFVNRIGVRRSDETCIDIENLEASIRKELERTVPRLIAVRDPIEVQLETPLDEDVVVKLPAYPAGVESKVERTLRLGKDETFLIDRSDFREVDSEDYFGLSLEPDKWVRLKKLGMCRIKKVLERDDKGRPKKLLAELDRKAAPKKRMRTTLGWLPKSQAERVTVREYGYLLKNPEIPQGVDWKTQINTEYLNERSDYFMEKNMEHIFANEPLDGKRVQFERIGYCIIDRDSDLENGKKVFNLITTLKGKRKI